jgi:hypothetical protein
MKSFMTPTPAPGAAIVSPVAKLTILKTGVWYWAVSKNKKPKFTKIVNKFYQKCHQNLPKMSLKFTKNVNKIYQNI